MSRPPPPIPPLDQHPSLLISEETLVPAQHKNEFIHFLHLILAGPLYGPILAALDTWVAIQNEKLEKDQTPLRWGVFARGDTPLLHDAQLAEAAETRTLSCSFVVKLAPQEPIRKRRSTPPNLGFLLGRVSQAVSELPSLLVHARACFLQQAWEQQHASVVKNIAVHVLNLSQRQAQEALEEEQARLDALFRDEARKAVTTWLESPDNWAENKSPYPITRDEIEDAIENITSGGAKPGAIF